MKMVPATELARVRGISRQALNKAISKGKVAGATQISLADRGLCWMVPESELSRRELTILSKELIDVYSGVSNGGESGFDSRVAGVAADHHDGSVGVFAEELAGCTDVGSDSAADQVKRDGFGLAPQGAGCVLDSGDVSVWQRGSVAQRDGERANAGGVYGVGDGAGCPGNSGPSTASDDRRVFGWWRVAITQQIAELREDDTIRSGLETYALQAARALDTFGNLVAARSVREGGKESVEAVQVIEQLVCIDGNVVARYPSLGDRPSLRSVERLYKRWLAGDATALLRRVKPKTQKRGCKSVSQGVQDVCRAQLTRWLVENWNRPNAALARDLKMFLEHAGHDCPPESWVLGVLRELKASKVLKAKATKGSRWKKQTSYIHRDWSGISPGDVMVADHRQADRFVITKEGKLVRPWITRYDDGRTGLPVGVTVLDSAPNQDSVILALIQAMLPKGMNDVNRHLGEKFLGKVLCGIPKYLYLDNGKDFSGAVIDGQTYEDGELKGIKGQRGKVHRAMDEEASNVVAAINRESGEKTTLMFGLPAELKVQVQRAEPYNARAKTVERSFGDDSTFDSGGAGYIGNSPGMRTNNEEERIAKFHKLAKKGGYTPQELAEKTGLWTMEQFCERYEAFLWDWAAREQTRSKRLWADGKFWSPLEFYARFRSQVVLPTKDLLERATMKAKPLTVHQGEIRFVRRRGEQKTYYTSKELAPLSGRKVVIHWSPLNPDFVDVVAVADTDGEGAMNKLEAPLRVYQPTAIPALGATREEMEFAKAESVGAMKMANQAVNDAMAGSVAFNPAAALVDQLRAEAENTDGTTRRGVPVGWIGSRPEPTTIDVSQPASETLREQREVAGYEEPATVIDDHFEDEDGETWYGSRVARDLAGEM